MKINYTKFPIFKCLKKGVSPFQLLEGAGTTVSFEKLNKHKETYELFWSLIQEEVQAGTAQIDFITEPIRELVDLDIKVGDKLHRERDRIEDCTGIFIMGGHPASLTYAYHFHNAETEKRVYFTCLQLVGDMVTAFEMGFWKYDDFPHISVSDATFNIVAESNPDYLIGYAKQMALQFCIFKACAELEIKIIDGSKNATSRKAKLDGEKYLNECPFPVTIINSNWFTRIVRTEGFSVSAHFRMQPYGPNRSQRKLIMIEEYQKHGYTRRAEIEN